ncbi:MAG: hypothetical protein JW947_08525 [Sedimentisphaerales bacterium]|nr:hypothetical protein [Sedimentisphaerales bacterium]
MKKICVILAITICFGLTGCKKSTPDTAEEQSPAEQVSELVKAEVEEAAGIDMTSTLDKLKEQAKSMNVDELKEMAEKYKAQYLSVKNDLTTKNDLLSKLIESKKFGPEIEGLGKDVEILKTTLSSLKERMMVYVDALKAQGVDISSFTLE